MVGRAGWWGKREKKRAWYGGHGGMGALDGSANLRERKRGEGGMLAQRGAGSDGKAWVLLHVMDGSVVAHHFSSPYVYELPLK